MSGAVRARIGRVRAIRTLSGGEAAAVRNMRKQMADLLAVYNRFIRELENASLDGLLFGMQPIFDRSQVLVPRKTGRLANSGFLEGRQLTRGPVVEVGYGRGGRPFYAAIVHERLEARHEPPTQAKYLQAAIQQEGPQIQTRYAQYVSREVFN